MPPTTCYGYKRRYRDVETIKKQIIIHGKNAGVIISDNNDGPRLFMDDFIKTSPKILSGKRRRIQVQPVQVVIQVPDVVDGTKQPMEQALAQEDKQPMADAAPVPMIEPEQPMADAAPVQTLVHTAEQPMAQVLMHTAEQPMADAAPVPIIQCDQPMEQAQVPMQEADAVPNQAQAPIAPPSAHLPNANGACKPLVLNGLTIEVDPNTFMINATQMCKAAGKEYYDYAKTAKAYSFLQILKSKPIFVGFDLIRSKPGHNGGTMVHRLIAYDLASWLSQDVKLQFYMWNDELRIENAALLTQIEELQAATVIAPPSAHLPNANGARKPLVLNGIAIEVDSVTFMVNATQMCRAAEKLFGNYWQLDSTKKYVQELSLDIGIPISKLVQRNQSGRGTSQDTNVHFLVALHLAYWLSTEVQVQFSKWIGELLLTGRVELGNEMNVQQLEDAWRRINEELQAKASADVSAAQDRSRDLELQLATIQEAHQRSDEEKNALVAIKVREDLEAAIQFQVNTTAPTIATYKEGDNVLYLARIDETKFKYGHTKNLKQRLEAHRRPGVYPTLELVWIVKSNNGVASEDQLHAYVKKKKIIAEYGTQREVIVLKSVDDLERMLKKMNKCALPRADADIDMKRMEEETKRMEITEKTKQMEINAKTKQMEINAKTMLLQMLASKTITVEQYLQIKD
jgi:hypothetical protein